MVCEVSHEGLSLVHVKIVYVVKVSAYCNLVLGVVLIQGQAIPSHHSLRDLLPLVELPSMLQLNLFLRVKTHLEIFLISSTLHFCLVLFLLVHVSKVLHQTTRFAIGPIHIFLVFIF